MTCSGGPYENRETRRFRAGAGLSTAIPAMRLLKGANEGIRRGLCRDNASWGTSPRLEAGSARRSPEGKAPL